MAAELNSQLEDELDEIVLAYLKAIDAGQSPDPQEILARHPEWHSELAAFFEDQERANQFSLPGLDLGNQAAAGTHPGTETAPDGPLPSTVAYQPESRERYTIIRFHAGGGIGDVYLAQDGDLGRQVALKELKPQFADIPMFRARFLEEARITGQLEHPGIVPVHEVTKRAGDQKHFYTMRFIKGRTLAHAIKAYHRKREAGQAGPLDLRELLNVFVGVCNAVAYAHSRGVIHRDLKPQNVALGDFGEALVLDWGLAKVLGEKTGEDSQHPVTIEPEAERGETMSGQRIGTISYMSPEQAEGRIDLMDRRTDVYGLGAILYEILTGEPPFTGPQESVVLDRVQHAAVTPPHQSVPATSPALEAVCLKALAKKREDRYESAKDVAQEIEQWLGDEPVNAWREPRTTRLLRWARRHRTVVASVAALLVTAVVALAISTFLIANAQKETEEARQKESSQRLRAEANLRRALSAGNQMLTRVGEKQLAEVPQMDDVRQKLLDDALQFYKGFSQEDNADPGLRREIGQAYQRTAHIRQILGKHIEAEEDYREALDIQTKLAVEFPQEPSYAHDIALSYQALGDLYWDQQGRAVQAEDAYEQAIKILKPLAEAHPKMDEFSSSLAATQNKLGTTYCDTRRLAKAESAFGKALEIRSTLDLAHPDVPAYREAVADSYESIGELYSSRRIARQGMTEADFQKAVAIRKQLANDHPKDPAYQDRLAKSYRKLGFYYESNGRIAQAEDPYLQALRICRKLAKDHPNIFEHQTEVALICGRLGTVCSLIGRRNDGDAYFKDSVGLFERLIADYPEHIRIALHFADISESKGVRRRDNNDINEALSCFARSVELALGVLRKEPQHTEARNRLVTTYMDRAEAFVRTERNKEALEDWDRMIELDKGPSSPLVRMFAAMARAHRGEHALAAAALDAMQADGVEPEYACYNFPCIYSLASAVVLKDDRLSPSEQKRLAERYAAKSVELLQKARADGFFETPGFVKYLRKDTDLKPLRERGDFKKLIRQLDEDAKAEKPSERK
jgi:eukaryotic-like serine/threonine-protein kinase